ncbi:MAG: ATP synthase F0 subunit B [Chryseobacterium sp.]|nr:MAG: ATP synthase F0 subunit B [Chryseobacterium sp.]
MDLLIPAEGTLIWTLVVFLLLVLLLTKFAWKPILGAIDQRETNIVDALNQATLARKEVENMKAENDRIIREAKIERDAILKEAREIHNRIVGEAKENAHAEGEKMIAQAKASIENERNAAMADIKSQIGLLSVNIAESILKQKLDNNDAQNELVASMLNESNLN